MKTNSARLLAVGALLGAGFTLYTVVAQGPLAPPGPPAPTMKSLDQIEPRTPISSLPVTINAPGSYYFTQSLHHISAGSAILINSSDVTLDLNGFTLSSDAGISGSAIVVNTADRVTIKNGNIVGASTVAVTGTLPNRTWTITPGGFTIGVEGVSAAGNEATDVRLIDLTCSKCRSNGGNTANPVNAGATANFDFPTSNTFGPIIVISGDMSANAAASHPWANIQY
jgi:hypothetical protein